MHVPTLKEIESLPWNGLKVVSTFSGTGGSCLGYRMAGCKVLWASDFIPAAQESYAHNHPQSFLNTKDIRKVSAKDICEEANIEGRDIDIFDGSPPCESFSTAGALSEKWGKQREYSGKVQRTDDLFWEYIRLVRDLQPRSFVAENVTGLVRGVSKGMFIKILKELREAGYRVQAKELDASWLGCATYRKRIIFIGTRNDLNADPVFPYPHKQRFNFNDAMANYPKDSEDLSQSWILPVDGITYQFWRSARQGETLGEKYLKETGRAKFFNHYKINPNAPIPTVIKCTVHFHHEQPRSLSIGEIKACSTFPHDFKLIGSFNQKWERVGNAVPPVMMREIARSLEKVLIR